MSRHERTVLRIMKALRVAAVFVVPLAILAVWAFFGWMQGGTA